MISLTERTNEMIKNEEPGYTIEKGKQFVKFQERLNKELLNHQVITNNYFTKWWSTTNLSKEQVTKFIVQFSVFSNQFLVAQLNKVINSDTLTGMRESKEILANELGVIFNAKGKEQNHKDTDPNLVSTTGTVDGGTFRFPAAHFEWIYKIAQQLDLEYSAIGRRCHGYDSTLFFCDELIRLYGSDNYNIAVAASYAVENWAAAGFWKELIYGLRKFNLIAETQVPLSFFTWHDMIEDQHAEHTQEELEELYFTQKINEDQFISDGNEMLEGVRQFWVGLEKII